MRKVSGKPTEMSGRSPRPAVPPKKKGNGDLFDKDFFRAVYLNNADGILIVNGGGVVRHMNPAAERLLGEGAEKLIDKRFIFPVSIDRPMELAVTGKQGEPTTLEIRNSEMTLEGQKYRVLCLRDVSEQVRMREQLRALSDVDPLTGLLNRRGFFDAAQRQLGLAKRSGRELTLFFLDLDGLKQINDTQGHLEGDSALLLVADILRKTFRQPDILSRFGGDEFSVLAIEAQKKDSGRIFTRLKKNLQNHNSHARPSKRLSFSTGMAFFNPRKPVSIEELIQEADIGMYKEKTARWRREPSRDD